MHNQRKGSHSAKLKKPTNPLQTNMGESWPAFTGLMAAFVLVLFMLILFFSIQLRTTEKKVWASSKEYRKKVEAYEKNKHQFQKLQANLVQQRASILQEKKANQSLLSDLKKVEKKLDDDDLEDGIKALLKKFVKERKQLSKERLVLRKERKKLEQLKKEKKSISP